jgi:hypothetical protein
MCHLCVGVIKSKCQKSCPIGDHKKGPLSLSSEEDIAGERDESSVAGFLDFKEKLGTNLHIKYTTFEMWEMNEKILTSESLSSVSQPQLVLDLSWP